MATYNNICLSIIEATIDEHGTAGKPAHFDIDVIKGFTADLVQATSKPSVAAKNGNWEKVAKHMAALRYEAGMRIYLTDSFTGRLDDPANNWLVAHVTQGRYRTGEAMKPYQEARRNEMVRMQVALVQLERSLWLAFEEKVPSYVTTDLDRFWTKTR